MRNIDVNRAQNYIKKHERYKKWVIFALCVSLLSGSVTFYMLNKPATAMTEEGAKTVGLVVDTADAEFEQSLINQMLEGERASEEEQLEELFGDGSDNENDGEDLFTDGESEDTDSEEDELSEDEEDEENSVKKIIKKVSTKTTKKSTGSASDEDIEDVVITVLYQDKEGEDIEESKELSITDSFNLKEEAREFEGYIFTKGFIGEDEVTSIVKKSSADAEVKDTKEADKKSSESDVEETEVVVEETEEVVYIDAETNEEVTFDGDDENVEVEVVYEEVEEKADEETEAADSDSEYTYYEATLADGSILVIDEDVELRLVYTKVNDQEVFEYEADGVKVTVKLSNPAALPYGVELKVNTLDEYTFGYNYKAYLDALNANAEDIAEANGTEEAVKYDSKNVVLFDICFMYEDKEFQLEEGTASVSIVFTNNEISDGLGTNDSESVTVVHMPISSEKLQEVDSTRQATDISASDITVEVLTDSTVDLDGRNDEISFETTSFSVYGALGDVEDRTWEGSDNYSAEEIVKMFGDATYFGVVANTYDGNNNDSETNVAVGKISNVQEYTIGNSTQVYTHLTDYNVTVNKEVFGPTKSGTFNFALFADVDGKDKISGSEFTITTDKDGKGSYSMDVVDYIKSHASLYVYELDQQGNAILNGKSDGRYEVTYEGDVIAGNSDVVSYYSDSYIEDLNGYRITDGEGKKGILRQIDGAAIYYKTSDSSYVGVTYYRGAPNNEVVGVYEGSFPVSISGMRQDAENASVRLANAVTNDSVEVVNIIGTPQVDYVGGNLESDLTKYYFKSKDDAYAVNKGFVFDSNKLLLIKLIKFKSK